MSNLDQSDRNMTERAAPPAPADRYSHAQLCLLCAAGSHRFALPMSEIVETMRMLPVETIAAAPPLVLGLSIIRGAPVAVVDTALLFDRTSARYTQLVTARTGGRTIAFAVDAVLGAAVVARHDLTQMPPLIGSDDAIVAMASRDRDLLFLLNAARIVPDDFVVPDHAGRVAS